MALFTNRRRPVDCIDRISNAMNEAMAIRDMLETAPKAREYRWDWDANCKHADQHLSEACSSLGAALTGLMINRHQPTRGTELKRLATALAVAEARAAAVEMAAAQHPAPPEPPEEELAHRVRRIVMGAVHPDNAADAAEREWRTKLCQTLFPEIDRVMKGTRCRSRPQPQPSRRLGERSPPRARSTIGGSGPPAHGRRCARDGDYCVGWAPELGVLDELGAGFCEVGMVSRIEHAATAKRANAIRAALMVVIGCFLLHVTV